MALHRGGHAAECDYAESYAQEIRHTLSRSRSGNTARAAVAGIRDHHATSVETRCAFGRIGKGKM
jgi:hypothetical protein